MGAIITANSQKGSLLLNEVRRKYPNYHPVLAMVDIAHNENASLELQFNCHKTVAKYIEPELKSIEVKGDFKQTQTVRVSLFGQDEPPETVQFQEVPAAQVADVPASFVDEAIATYSLGGSSGF